MIRIEPHSNREQEPCFGCRFPGRHGYLLTAGIGAGVVRLFLCRMCLREVRGQAERVVDAMEAGPSRPVTGGRNGAVQ